MIATPPLSCNLNVPALSSAPNGGVAVGHVRGSCNFPWHSVNQVMYKDRWHVLGTKRLSGGAPRELVTQPAYVSYYEECGYWKLRVKVFQGPILRDVIDGPVSEFCS